MAGAVALAVAVSGSPAAAATRTGGYKGCAVGYHVITWARAGGGDVAHRQRVGNDVHTRIFENLAVGTYSSYAGWPTRRSIDEWLIVAPSISDAGVSCVRNPI